MGRLWDGREEEERREKKKKKKPQHHIYSKIGSQQVQGLLGLLSEFKGSLDN